MIIKKARIDDMQQIIELITELAEYENLKDEVKIDPEIFKKHVFEREFANVLVAKDDENIVGYALYFYSFSTFLGRGGIYLEDIYVKPEFRGRGIGLKFIKTLAKICDDEGFGRLEWECLDWNESSIKFYESLGAKRQNGWIKFRMSKEEIENMSKF